MDIAAWLRQLGLERYEEAFRENEIDAAILPKLTADDLKDLGVTTVGHRRKLLEAIAALAEPASVPQVVQSAPAKAAREGLSVRGCRMSTRFSQRRVRQCRTHTFDSRLTAAYLPRRRGCGCRAWRRRRIDRGGCQP